jgi:outer membrane protein TolC
MNKIAVSLLLASAFAAVAQTNNVRVMTLQDCFAEALKHNFDVQVERYEPQLSLYDLRSAYAGYDPEFSLSGTHSHNKSGGESTTNGVPFSNNNSFDTGLGGVLPFGTLYTLSGGVSDTTTSDSSGGSAGVKLTQPLLKNFWTDGTRLNIAIAKNNLKVSEQGLRAQAITTVTAVENAFYELIYARENVKVQQQALELAQKQLSDDQQRVQIKVMAELGGTIEQDEAQVASSRAGLISAQFGLVSAQNELKNLITDNYHAWHDVDIEPSASMEATREFFNLQDSWSKGMTQRPDLIEARLNAESQGLRLKYSFNQLFPELDLSGSYGFNGAGQEFSDSIGQVRAGNRPYYSYGFSFSIPLSNARARNAHKSAKVATEQVLLRLKQLEQNIMVDIDNAVKSAQSSWESLEATRKARVSAEAALKAEQGKYDAGKSTTFVVLQLQNRVTSARSQEIRAIANYNESLASLAQKEASTLERRKIDFKLK